MNHRTGPNGALAKQLTFATLAAFNLLSAGVCWAATESASMTATADMQVVTLDALNSAPARGNSLAAVDFVSPLAAVPLPQTVWLFLTGLLGLLALNKIRRR